MLGLETVDENHGFLGKKYIRSSQPLGGFLEKRHETKRVPDALDQDVLPQGLKDEVGHEKTRRVAAPGKFFSEIKTQ
jgi:hypothetical protein